MSAMEKEEVFKRCGVRILGSFRGRHIDLDTEGCRASDLATNILASFDWPKEVVIRCGNAIVISTEETVGSAPATPEDVNFLNGVNLSAVYEIAEDFQNRRTERRFYLRTAENGFVVRRVRWEGDSGEAH